MYVCVQGPERVMRAYNFNQDDFQNLLVRVVQRLSAPGELSDLIVNTLQEICQHFKFGCGVVYETDYTNTLQQRETYHLFDENVLPTKIDLGPEIDGVSLGEKFKRTIYASSAEQESANEHQFVFDLFPINTILLVPILDEGANLCGLLGLMDRRQKILLRESDIGVAETTLRLLANYVRLRISRRRVEMARASLINTLNNMGVDIYVNDFETHEILYVNESMAKPYGGLENMLGKKCWAALYSDKTGECEYCPQKKLIDENGKPTKVYSWDYQRPFDGSWFRVFSAAFNWIDGRLAHVVTSVDISENKHNEELITKLATMDVLTNLPNRRKLLSDFNEARTRLAKNGGEAYLLFFDLDDFKGLNDKYGHAAGDDFLAYVGSILLSDAHTDGHAYRHGGDEFVVFLDGISEKTVQRIVDNLLAHFETPWHINGEDVISRATIGIAKYPDDGLTLEELLYAADKKMYEAKHLGKGRAFFSNGTIVKPKPKAP